MQDGAQSLTFSSQHWGRLLDPRTRAYVAKLIDPKCPLPDVLCIQDIPFDALGYLQRLPYIQFGVMTNHLINGVRIPVGIAIASKYFIRSATHFTCWGDGTLKDLYGVDEAHVRFRDYESDRVVQVTEDRLVVHATIVKQGVIYPIANTHGMWVRDGGTNAMQLRSMQELRWFVRAESLRHRGIVLMGCLNFPRNGEIYQKFVSLDEGFRDWIPSDIASTLDSTHPVSEQGIAVVSDYVMTLPDGRNVQRCVIEDVKVVEGFSKHCFVYGTIVPVL